MNRRTSPTLTRVETVADFFRRRPGEWIDGMVLAKLGGQYAWRSRVSDCRRQLDMNIVNRQREVLVMGEMITVSEYMYSPISTTPLLGLSGAR